MLRSDMEKRCIEACADCHRVCVETTIHCLTVGGGHAEMPRLRLMEDCAQICQASGDLLVRGSEFMLALCSLCADACERCAESCDAFADDPVMRVCANRCRGCADVCREMASP